MNTTIDETVGRARAKHHSCLRFRGGVLTAFVSSATAA